MKRLCCSYCHDYFDYKGSNVCSSECLEFLKREQEKKRAIIESLDNRVFQFKPSGKKKKKHGKQSKKNRKKSVRRYQPHPFYDSKQWQELRYHVLKHFGRVCSCCRTTKGVMHVDHIKPRSKYPELALRVDNMQVLCEACNLGKGSTDETDWRHK